MALLLLTIFWHLLPLCSRYDNSVNVRYIALENNSILVLCRCEISSCSQVTQAKEKEETSTQIVPFVQAVSAGPAAHRRV